MDPVETSNDIQVSDDGTSGWKDKTASYTYLLKEADIGKFFRSNSIAIDSIEQELWYESEAIGPVTSPLVVGTPVASGEPYVGYTLSCSEPSISGGSGNCQVDYFWVDESNAMVWETTYMGPTTKVVEYDLGKKMKCLVTVTDRITGESETVASNQLGPINRPTLPEFDAYVDGNLYDDPSTQIGVAINGAIGLVVQPETVSNPALDITYQWTIRTGTGRLSGDANSEGIIYMAPDTAPAGAMVQCTVTSRDAADNAYAAEVTILIAE